MRLRSLRGIQGSLTGKIFRFAGRSPPAAGLTSGPTRARSLTSDWALGIQKDRGPGTLHRTQMSGERGGGRTPS